MTPRLPDFIIIGAMKAGTTTLFRWLSEHPDCFTPRRKEPNFFVDERAWRRGPAHYARLFAAAGPDRVAGEASVAYTDPDRSALAAARMVEVVPDVRIVYLIRHPVARAYSHFLHEVQRGRERRSFRAAVSDPTSPYLARSAYWKCLSPYVDRFGREQICVVALESLSDGSGGWEAILDHLHLPRTPMPKTVQNVTVEKRRFTPLMQSLYDHRFRRLPFRLPPPARQFVRHVLLRDFDPPPFEPIAAQAVERLWTDITQLEAWLDAGELWPRSGEDLGDDR